MLTQKFWLELQKRWGLNPKDLWNFVYNNVQNDDRTYRYQLPDQLDNYIKQFPVAPSTHCCGVGEVGRLMYEGTNMQEVKILAAITDALTKRKGLLYYFIPTAAVSAEILDIRPRLESYGFKSGRSFYNPNSGHNVVEFTLELPALSSK